LVLIRSWLIVAFSLCLITQAAANRANAGVSAQSAPGISILSGGRIAIRGGASATMIVSSEALLGGRTPCPGIGEASAGSEVVTIGSDPQTTYRTFMRVANWLEDCGVHNLLVTGRIAVDQTLVARVVTVGVQMGGLGPVVVPCRPVPRGEQPICPKRKAPTYVSLQQDGLILWGSLGRMPTSLGDLAADLPKSLGSENPTDERVLLRADSSVTYAQFIQVLDQLNRDGYTRIGLINENL
jgi:biopolymer transport protein ExbD